MANPQHLSWLLEGVGAWNARRKQDTFTPELDGEDISRRLGVQEREDIREIGAQLKGINLSGANLRGSTLRDVDLSGSSFHQADLTQANLKGSQFTGSLFAGTILRNANLMSANLADTKFFFRRFHVSSPRRNRPDKSAVVGMQPSKRTSL